MKHHPIGMSALAGVVALQSASAAIVTFEEITLPPAGYLNQSTPAGGFNVLGTTFRNNYNAGWGAWYGFAISNQTNTTEGGFTNQYSGFAGGGEGGSANYAVGYYSTFDAEGPWITFSSLSNMFGKGAYFTNATYAALSILKGDSFSKKFGGDSGNDADWFKLTIQGWAAGAPTGTSVDFYLADYRFSDNSRDYVIKEWTYVDFSPLGQVDQVRFTMSSSDNGAFGMNTPSYFAMDTVAVPEPSSALCALAGLALLRRRKR